MAKRKLRGKCTMREKKNKRNKESTMCKEGKIRKSFTGKGKQKRIKKENI